MVEGFDVRALNRGHNKQSKMNRTIQRNSILVCALLGLMVAGQAMGATLRYNGSGDYNDILTNTW